MKATEGAKVKVCAQLNAIRADVVIICVCMWEKMTKLSLRDHSHGICEK